MNERTEEGYARLREELARRRRSFRLHAARSGVDGFLVNHLPDVRYLCGFSGSSGMVLLLRRSGYFLTDFRYREQASLEVLGLRAVVCEGFGKALRDILNRLEPEEHGLASPVERGFTGEGTGRGAAVIYRRTGGGHSHSGGEEAMPPVFLKGKAGGPAPTSEGGSGGRFWRIGFDPRSLTCAELADLRKSLRGIASLVPLKGDFQSLRAVKSRMEIDILRKGIERSEAAFREALRRMNAKATEWDLALEIDFAARRQGAEAPAFETIVAAGERGALVHAKPSHRRLKGTVVVDWGVVNMGYCTDCTRTLAWGRVPAELKTVHRLVLEARERTLERVRPGVRASEVDRAAREVLERAGYGSAFGHGLGHGVGLEVHERPVLGPRSREVLEEGMVFTVEPGVYLPGLGGVRVEDMVLVTPQGAEVLTALPRSLDPSDY